ncbi:MAG: hypothetical protein M0C28_43310 [Candidatus Moduliflexus flocculans]|nr:hypothetical protein [Candidatus Moduliflexus flocculans]
MTETNFQRPKYLECDYETADRARTAASQAQPFERGYGVTVGNALRRILLSSIDGRGHHRRPHRRRPARVLDHPRRRRGRRPTSSSTSSSIPLKLQGDEPQTDDASRRPARRRSRRADIAADADIEILDTDVPHRHPRQRTGRLEVEMRRQARPRLHPGRPELRRGPRASTTSRSTPSHSPVLEGQLQGRAGPRRQAHRLREA